MPAKYVGFACALCVLSHFVARVQAQPNASSACSIEGPNNCQLFDGSPNRTPSDDSFFYPAGDDFVPQGSILQSLCVWGQYVDIGFEAPQADCADTVSADSFVVAIYESDGDLPGSLIGESTATSVRSPVLASRQTQGPATVFLFELTLDTPIAGLINDGRSYWLRVGNNSESTVWECVWYWSQLSADAPTGNRYAVIQSSLVHAADQAFCLDMNLGAIGPVLRPCCGCDGTCNVVSLADCDTAEGTWFGGFQSCSEATCPIGPPSNDACTAAIPIVDFFAEFNSNCATTDDFNPVDTELGPTDITNDVWFSYVHDGEFECSLGFDNFGDFDSVIAVYYDPNNPTICPCPTNETGALTLVGASDEFWPGVVGGDGHVTIPTPPGECGSAPGCYTIRIGGFEGDKGAGYVSVNCAVPGFAQASPPVVDPSVNKTRFISMSIPSESPCFGPGSGQLAVRVTLTSLHHVNPPYSGGPSIPFTSFEGQMRWVGPPAQYVESAATPTPFWASTLQCQPHYRDWSTLGLLHVTGSAIVPSSTYHVETVGGACLGNESHWTCQTGGSNVSTPVEVKTTRWADVETPFNPPSTSVQPDVADIAALVNKFRNALGAPIKARALIQGTDAFGNFNLFSFASDLNFSHIAGCVDAFRGTPYPFKMGMCAGTPTPPATGACTTDADCLGANGAAPCKLFAMGKCTGSPNADCTRDSQCFAGTTGAPPCIRFFGCP